jgi:hypothetical protein
MPSFSIRLFGWEVVPVRVSTQQPRRNNGTEIKFGHALDKGRRLRSRQFYLSVNYIIQFMSCDGLSDIRHWRLPNTLNIEMRIPFDGFRSRILSVSGCPKTSECYKTLKSKS